VLLFVSGFLERQVSKWGGITEHFKSIYQSHYLYAWWPTRALIYDTETETVFYAQLGTSTTASFYFTIWSVPDVRDCYMTSGLSLWAVTRITCYGRVCLIGHWCYGQRVNLPVLGKMHPQVTSLLQVWGLRQWVTQNLMTALHVATSMRTARSDEIFYSRFSLSHFFPAMNR